MHDVVVIGGGQAGLAVGFYLRRTELDRIHLDDRDAPGGAWRETWDSLRLFSPARWSSLPGRIMEGGPDYYPTREEVLHYLADYEDRYGLKIERPVRVEGVEHVAGDGDLPAHFNVRVSSSGARATLRSRAVISATGRWAAPRWPDIPGLRDFPGTVVHSARYRSPTAHGLVGARVAIIGGGNSGAQILAEVSRVAETRWSTLGPPTFLPDDVDGRVLFDEATARYRAKEAGLPEPPRQSLGDIVMIESVREARDRGALESVPPIVRFEGAVAVGEDGGRWEADAVIVATGFDPSLDHLDDLDIRDEEGRVATEGTRSTRVPGLWFVGYGAWTGYASATLVGVGRSARTTVTELEEWLRRPEA